MLRRERETRPRAVADRSFGDRLISHRGGVNYPPNVEVARAGDGRFADPDAPVAVALLLDGRTTGAPDRAGDAGAQDQMIVGRVDDRVTVVGGDVALQNSDDRGHGDRDWDVRCEKRQPPLL